MPPRGQRLVIAGAKGGVGKTVMSIAIGLQTAASGRRVIIADADFNLPNLAISFDQFPEQSLGSVMRGEQSIDQVLIHAEGGIKLVPGDFDHGGLGSQNAEELHQLTLQLSSLAEMADLVIYDTTSSSGTELDVVLPLADRVLVVMTAEPSGMAGAFATLRAIQRYPDLCDRAGLLINKAANRPQAEQYGEHLIETAQNALGMTVPLVGYVLSDPHVREAVRSKKQFILRFPYAPASLAIRQLVERLADNGKSGAGSQQVSLWSQLFGR
ncbi:AAA family ATPase [bacterium AH-315-M10]|nr:AAA family ATPase [bacterium AH-315-M10]